MQNTKVLIITENTKNTKKNRLKYIIYFYFMFRNFPFNEFYDFHIKTHIFYLTSLSIFNFIFCNSEY